MIYSVPFCMTMTGTVLVEAASFKEAAEKVENMQATKLAAESDDVSVETFSEEM